jgi:hypothetical protein
MQTISATAVIGRAFAIYREHPGPLIGAAVIVFLIDAVARAVFDSGVLVLVASLVGLVVHTFYQGLVVRLVDDVRDGQLDSSMGQLFSSVSPVVLPLIGVSIVVGVCVTVGLVLLIIPGLFLLTIWAVVAPVIVLERVGVFDSLGRSRDLVSGNGWNVFGLIVILFLLMFVLVAVLAAIGAAAGAWLSALLVLIGSVLIAPVTGLSIAVLYFDLREAKGEAVAAPVAPAV